MPQSNAQYRCIGKGFCGSVWTLETPQNQDDRRIAIKREDGGPGRSVTNDYNMHLRILHSASQQPPSMPLSIPSCHNLIQPDDTWWLSNLHHFPSGYTACRALISERIPKIPRPISDKIVDLFCAGNAPLSTFVKGNPDDNACLIRPYLGHRRRHRQEGQSNSRFQRFSLRNVPLHIDQMEALGLDSKAYAETMAEALALMHWGAEIDANDVEFVLAPPRSEHTQSMVFQSDYMGTHCMWILDFDCCRPMSMDVEGVEQACAAFFRNDPFYPRPGTGETADEELWAVFKRRFLESSYRFLSTEKQHLWNLVDRLMGRIEEEARSRSGNRESGASQGTNQLARTTSHA
ncbi:hypothetical protein ACET3X_003747 [Alternaria dauci]|uniref:DUF3669 domain-containing protein n=1 Tax=Alternaria dauci TaxID=48095 RepID=A0ABR3UKX2_9PLEO